MTSKSNTLATLYARDSKGQIKYWSIVVLDDGNTAQIKISYGLLGGKETIDYTNVTEGKNIGKSNATTAYTQAVSNALSRIKTQKKEGYKSLDDLNIISSEDPSIGYLTNHKGEEIRTSDLKKLLDLKLPEFNTDDNDNLKPMKCQPYYNKKGKITIKFPCFGQPKINGIRCVARLEIDQNGLFKDSLVKLRSKKGLEYSVPKHIINQLQSELFFITKYLDAETSTTIELVFDGELYIPGFLLQKIRSAATKINIDTEKVEFHIFDLSIPFYNQTERFNLLTLLNGQIKVLSEKNPNLFSHIKIVPTKIIRSDAEAQTFTDQCIAEGYEGAVFRDMKAMYKFGSRASTITKLKRSQDAEFKIIDVILPEDGNPQYSVLLCQNDINNLTFKVAIEGDLDYRAELYHNRKDIIGKEVTVKFFERTADDLPFHAIAIEIRDYE